jgi:hypothetical protein
MFLFTVGSVCRVKRFTGGLVNSLKDVARPSAEVAETTVSGFDALVKRWVKCITVGGGYVEK